MVRLHVFHPGHERISIMIGEFIKMALSLQCTSLQWALAALFAGKTSALLKRGNTSNGFEPGRKLHTCPHRYARTNTCSRLNIIHEQSENNEINFADTLSTWPHARHTYEQKTSSSLGHDVEVTVLFKKTMG